MQCNKFYLAGEEFVGEAGEPGVSFRSLQGEDPLVDSPDLRREFCRDSPVPIWLDWGKGAGVARTAPPSSSACSRWAAKARVRSRWSWGEEQEGPEGLSAREEVDECLESPRAGIAAATSTSSSSSASSSSSSSSSHSSTMLI